MSTTITFTGFSPDHPQGRDFSLWRRVPAKNREEDATLDLRRFINCLQEIVNLLLIEVDEFTNLYDPDLCSDDVIDGMLYDMGNPFTWAELELTRTQLRKLLRLLVPIYKSKGTKPGIENAVLFLLGEDVTVVPYMKEGWVLGVDELGEGSIAQIKGLGSDGPPAGFDFTLLPPPWTISFSVDGGPDQVITFVAGDFADPSAAEAEEVEAVLDAGLTGAGCYIVNDGAPAFLQGNAGPFNLVGGEILQLLVGLGSPVYEIQFKAEDFSTPGSATVEEVVKILWEADIPGMVPGQMPNSPPFFNSEIAIVSLATGDDAFISSVNDPANTASLPLGIVLGSIEVGQPGKQVVVYSETVGTEASIECTTPAVSADILLGFFGQTSAATGGAVLAPSEVYTLYSFDIETQVAVDEATEALIRKIAEYMKVAHEHLINIRVAPSLPWPEGWQLGVGQLDVGTELTE